MTGPVIPTPATPTPQAVALAWLASVIPTLQAGKGLLTPITSWQSSIFATVSTVVDRPDPYVPVRDPDVQIDIWGRPSPDGQYRGVPVNQCGSIAEFLHDRTVHFNPLVIPASGNYASVYVGDAYTSDMGSAYAEKPPGATVSLARAQITICFAYKIL